MPGKYKLTYFNARGRAEVARYMFVLTGTAYEDIRIEGDWPKHKPNTPFGSLPVLEVDGQKICQSGAINRFVARELGLAGKSSLDQAKVDMIHECVSDVIKPASDAMMEKDETKKAAIIKKYQEEQLPTYLASLEKLLVANKGGNTFFVGDSITLADIVFYNGISIATALHPTLSWDKYPKLKGLVDRTAKNPKIKEWEEKRPKTSF